MNIDKALARYRVVFAPLLAIIEPALQKKLCDFVSAGGHLILGPRAGFFDADLRLLPEARPGALLAEALGAVSAEFYALPDPVPVHGDLGTGQATTWAELLEVSSADVLARFGAGQGWIAGQPAVVTRAAGAGRITYVAAKLDQALLTALGRWACQQAGVALPWGDLPEGVEVSCRSGQGRTLYILCNHSGRTQSVRLPVPAVSLVGPEVTSGALELPANEVAVLQRR